MDYVLGSPTTRVGSVLVLTSSLWLLACGQGASSAPPLAMAASGASSSTALGGGASGGSSGAGMAGGSTTGVSAGGGTTGGLGGSGASNGGPVLSLPIEVLGNGSPDTPTVASTTLVLTSATAAVQSLYVQCHRCGFYDPPEFEALKKPLTTVKASLRVDGDATIANSNAPWIDITDSNVKVEPVAAAHGGINGGLVTLSFQVPIDDATRGRLVGVTGTNKIEFRFNGTNGGSNGYRVLDVQFQDANGANLSPMTKAWADIFLEKKTGQAATADSAAGQALWTGRNILIKSPIVPRTIRAACNDCHASDGRDLQYFNYSNNSIVQRSMFHGLSETQGKQIAAYLRASTYTKVPHVAAAAPWNPPFQPGPGLDAKPAVEWTAGAGLDAVLPDGKAFVKAFAGQPVDASPLTVTQAQIDATLDATKVMNTRELAIPLQFPDWNSWLPIVHPLDLWAPDAGQTSGLFETGNQGKSPLAAYQAIEAWLDANKNPNGVYGDWSHLTANQRNQIQGMLLSFGSTTTDFGGGSRGTRVSPDPSKPFGIQLAAAKMLAAVSSQTASLANLNACGPTGPCTPFSTESFLERADVGLYHWMGIKQWELVETYGLQAQQSFHGSVDSSGKWQGQGEARGWPFSWPSIFYLAPHMLYAPTSTPSGTREFYFSWEKRLVSYYRTNQWYELQVTINPGWAGASNGAIDWPYTTGFITGLSDDLLTAKAPGWIPAAHLARYFEVIGKLAQLANTNIPFFGPNPSDPTNLFADQGMQSKADLLFKLAPGNVLDSATSTTGASSDQPTRFRLLEQLAPGAYLLFVNGNIALYDTLFENTSRAQYRICDPNNMTLGEPEQFAGQRFCIDAARTPLPKDGQGQTFCPNPSNSGYTTEQFSVYGVMAAKQLGADAALVQRWSTWNDQMWPN